MTPATLISERPSRILVAGADPEQRAAVLHDLNEALPPDTQIGEAGAIAEVLAPGPLQQCGDAPSDLGRSRRNR